MILKKEPEQKKGLVSFFLPLLYCTIIIFTFIYKYDQVFDKKADLGGDNMSYYMLGKALASGQGYVNVSNIKRLKHNHFPPGYPLVIATVSKLFSEDITFVKKVNGFLLISSILLLFFVLYSIIGNYHIPFIVCLYSVLNYSMLYYSFIMMSEITFFAFSILGLWLTTKLDFDKPIHKNWLFFLLIICIAFLYHVRALGIALFVAILFYTILKRKWIYSISFFTGFILLSLPWFIRSKSLGGSAHIRALILKNYYKPELGYINFSDFIDRIFSNIQRYITKEIPIGIFNHIKTDYQSTTSSTEWVACLLIIILIVVGIYHVKKYQSLIITYVIAYAGVLIIWPTVWYGVRFMLPLIPLLVFLLIYGIEVSITFIIKKKLNKSINSSYLSISIVIILMLLIPNYTKPLKDLEKKKRTHYPPNFKNYFNIAKWVKKNTPENSVTSCRKPQLFHLYSEKYVTSYKRTLDQEELINNLKENKVNYVVLEQLGYSSTARYLYPAIKNHPENFKPILHLKNPDTYLLEFINK